MTRYLNLDSCFTIDPNVYQVTYKGRIWNTRPRGRKGVVQHRRSDGNFTAVFYVDCFGINCVSFY